MENSKEISDNLLENYFASNSFAVKTVARCC